MVLGSMRTPLVTRIHWRRCLHPLTCMGGGVALMQRHWPTSLGGWAWAFDMGVAVRDGVSLVAVSCFLRFCYWLVSLRSWRGAIIRDDENGGGTRRCVFIIRERPRVHAHRVACDVPLWWGRHWRRRLSCIVEEVGGVTSSPCPLLVGGWLSPSRQSCISPTSRLLSYEAHPIVAMLCCAPDVAVAMRVVAPLSS